MKNLTIGWPNYIDSSNVYGGIWMDSLPLSNLKDRRLLQVARSVDVQKHSTQIIIDLQKPRRIGALGIMNANFSIAGKYRWVASNVSNFSTQYPITPWYWAWDHGAIPDSLLEWDDANFFAGTVSDEAKAGLRTAFIKVVDSRPVFRYLRLEIDDETNPDVKFHIGRLAVTDAWTLSRNFSWGESLGFEDSTEFDTNLSKEEFFTSYPVRRTYDVTVDRLGNDEVYARVVDMLRQAGLSSELLIVPDADDVANAFRRNIYARFSNLSPVIREKFKKTSVKFSFKELM